MCEFSRDRLLIREVPIVLPGLRGWDDSRLFSERVNLLSEGCEFRPHFSFETREGFHQHPHFRGHGGSDGSDGVIAGGWGRGEGRGEERGGGKWRSEWHRRVLASVALIRCRIILGGGHDGVRFVIRGGRGWVFREGGKFLLLTFQFGAGLGGDGRRFGGLHRPNNRSQSAQFGIGASFGEGDFEVVLESAYLALVGLPEFSS